MKRSVPIFLSIGGVVAMLISGIVVFSRYSVYEIPSSGMSPTLNPGDRVIARDKVDKVHRGDIVVFHGAQWKGADPRQPFVKRVIGIEGDTVACCDHKGRLSVNGLAIVEPYLNVRYDTLHPIEYSVLVPHEAVFVLGDNRDNSIDSRFAVGKSNHGAIPVAKVSAVLIGNDTSPSAFVDAGVPYAEIRNAFTDWAPFLVLTVGAVTTFLGLAWLATTALLSRRSIGQRDL